MIISICIADRRRWCRSALVLGLALAFGNGLGARAASPAMDFQEVFQLLKSNLAGATEAGLSDAAAKGLIAELGPRVSLIESTAGDSATGAAVSAGVFEKHYGYVRVQKIGSGSAAELSAQYDGLCSTNVLKGLVLDLRYAGGADYSAAVAIADRFVATELPLVEWGEGWRKSTVKTNSISLPVAILVNRKTSGAAEALAGMLRYRDVGLLIGTNTAGQASVAKIFTLKTGQRLRVAVAPLKVADGRELPFTGIPADLGVTVASEDELAYYEDAYKVLAKAARAPSILTNDVHATATNRAPRRRMNEAELVRMSRDGQTIERDSPTVSPTLPVPEPAVPQVTDPALARALDLLKGLAVVQQFRSI